ncbi:pyridoxal-phosphate dependent enzyme [Cyclobacterium plantarum]|uniref:pyridoxal-phosphate dependent enzyme n=1 Tax=Cyclobacterium plantarum TaxID=2716263 RepID=UPI003F6F07DD
MKGIWKYKDLMELPTDLPLFSLGEGGTPLIQSKNIGPEIGIDNLYFKLETANPSGSYKDRFAAFAIAEILNKKSKICLATSSGNTGAALAAYSAAAGLPCKIAIVEGTPEGKLKQMRAFGAKLFMIKGFGISSEISERVFDKLAKLAIQNHTRIQVSAFKYCPIGMKGVQSISFEIAEDMPEATNIFVPAGGGGLALAVVRGFQRWNQRQPGFKVPRIHCVQPEGNNTIAGNLRNGLDHAQPVTDAATKISGLQVANVIDGNDTLKACRDTKGNGYLVTDEEVFECQRLLAEKEGIFAEPAGAVSLAGWLKAVRSGELKPEDKAICIVTGNGFKDPPSIENLIEMNPVQYLDEKSMDAYFKVE